MQRHDQRRPPPALLKATWDHFSFFSQLSEEHAAQLISRMVVPFDSVTSSAGRESLPSSLTHACRAQTVKTYRKDDYIIRKGTIGTSVVCTGSLCACRPCVRCGITS
jgi:hypothetical protein